MKSKPTNKIEQPTKAHMNGTISLSDQSSHNLIQELSDYNRANQEPKNDENYKDSNPLNPLSNHKDHYSGHLEKSFNDYEEQKNKIIEVINVPLNMGQNDISKEFSNVDFSKIIIENDSEESEEEEEISGENEEIEKMKDKKKDEEKNIIEEFIVGFKNNTNTKINENINKIENMYTNFNKLIEKKKSIYQKNFKRQYKFEISNDRRSFSVDNKKIKQIESNIEKKKIIRNFSTNQKKYNKFQKVFRCLYTENGNYICNEIPSMKIERNLIIFSCIKNHRIKIYPNELINLSLNNKLFRFISIDANNKKCPIHKNELLIDFCLNCMENACKECIKINHSCKKGKEHKFYSSNINLLLRNIKKKYKKYINHKERLINLINKEKSIIDNILDEMKKINYGNELNNLVNLNIYSCLGIIKKSILKYFLFNILLEINLEGQRLLVDIKRSKNLHNELINYEVVKKIWEKKEIKRNRIKKNVLATPLQSYIKLFVKFKNKDVNINNLSEYLYLGITTESGLAIYFFDFYGSNIYQKINGIYIDIKIIENVLNLDAFLDQNSKNTYFLICSRKENKIAILKIFNENDKIEMKVIQTKEINNSFLASTIFKFNDKYYLLNLDKTFTVWEFDEKNLLQEKYTVKQNNLNLKDNEINFSEINVCHPIIFLEEKGEFIIQLSSSIIVYKIDQKSKEELILIAYKLLNTKCDFSIFKDNFCIIKDEKDKKYLYLMIAGKNKNNCGVICEFDLNNYKFLNERKFNADYRVCKRIKKIISLDNNIILGTVEVNERQKNMKKIYKKYSKKLIVSIHYCINNEEKKLEFKFVQGFCSCNDINCREFICGDFVIVEKKYIKKVFKLRDNKKLIPLFTLFSPSLI